MHITFCQLGRGTAPHPERQLAHCPAASIPSVAREKKTYHQGQIHSHCMRLKHDSLWFTRSCLVANPFQVGHSWGYLRHGRKKRKCGSYPVLFEQRSVTRGLRRAASLAALRRLFCSRQRSLRRGLKLIFEDTHQFLQRVQSTALFASAPCQISKSGLCCFFECIHIV